MNRSFTSLLLLVPCLALAGAPSGSPVPSTVSQTPSAPSLKDLYLRAVPDDDPSEYIGAFVMDKTLTPDENMATKTRCSSYVSYKKVGTGGVTTTNYFKSSVGGALKFGIPPVAFGSAKSDAEASLLIEYTAMNKWQAKVADPGGFEDCCTNYPGSCSEFYIGDFTTGTGKVYYGNGLDASGDTTILTPVGGGKVSAYGGKQWVFGRELPTEVAFAFQLKMSPMKIGPMASDPLCNSDWKNNVPNDPRGHVERAISDVLYDKAGVLANVRDKANQQISAWCSSQVSYSRSGGRTDAGTGTGLSSDIGSSSSWDASSTATVSGLRELCSEIEEAGSPRGTQYRGYGLFMLPESEIKATCGGFSGPPKGSGSSGPP